MQCRHDWSLLDPDVLAWRIEAGPDDVFLEEMFAVRPLIEPEAAPLAAEQEAAGDVAELARSTTAYAETMSGSAARRA